MDGHQEGAARSARATLVQPELQVPFERDGYCVVPFLDDQHLAAVEAVYRSIGRAPDDPAEAVHFGFFSQDAAWKRMVREELRAIVAPLVEEHFDRHRLAYAMFITKWPGDRSAFGPHRDPWFVDETRFRSATLWCPLVDTPPASGPDNGSLHFVPGSHRFTDAPRIHDASALLFEGAEELILSTYGHPARLRAGEAVVFDNGMIHYSYRNASERPRTVLALGLIPAEAELFYLQFEPPDAIGVHAVDTDYFIEHNPFSMAFGLGHYEEVARLHHDPPQVTEEEFRAWCDAALEHVDPARLTAQIERPTADLSSDAFCFVCGGREGLEDDDAPDHASVMKVCPSCTAEVAERYTERDVPGPMAEPDKPVVPPLGPRPTLVAGGLPAGLEGLVDDGFAVVPAPAGASPAGAIDAAAGLLGGSDPVVRTIDPPPGSELGAGLDRSWSVVDEADGQRSWLLWTPVEASGPARVRVVAGSHQVDPVLRGAGFDPEWIHDPRVRERAEVVTVAIGEVLVVDPAVLHQPLTGPIPGVRSAVLAVLPAPGATLQRFRRLADGRVARYPLAAEELASIPLYGAGDLPPRCPITIHPSHPPHVEADAVDRLLPPPAAAPEPVPVASPIAGASGTVPARRPGHRLRRWARTMRRVQGTR